jgi:hypothetical protein
MSGRRGVGDFPVLVAAAGVAALVLGPVAGVQAAERLRGGAACGSTAKQAETLIGSGKLRDAQTWLEKCAQPRCATVVRQRCTAKLAQLVADIPTVIPVATSESGQTLADVEVTMDGQLLTSKLDGRALPIDPGEHEFSFTSPGGKQLKHKTVVLQGQRNRVLELSLAPPEPAAPPVPPVPPVEAKSEELPGPTRVARSSSEEPPRQQTAGHPVAPWVLAGIGVAGLTSFGVLTNWGRRDDQILVNNCSPDCKPQSIDHIRDLYLGAKISLGVGLAALAGATWLFISNGSADSREAAAPSRQYVLDLRPTRSGAVAGVAGTF